jgi:cytochrome c-type biogenesis protein CcmH/NrfG
MIGRQAPNIMESDFGINNRIITISAHKRPLLIVFLVIVMLAVFWQSTNHEFLCYDDDSYVTDNLHIKTGLTYRNMLWAFTTTEASNWHPVTWLSHMLDCQIHGLNPKGHHLTNVLFHIANTLLLSYLLVSATQNYWQSIFVAALFALHPLHVESVAWIAERKDLLSTFFMFGTLILYTRYTKNPRPLLYILTLLAYVFGLMSKPMLVTLPFVMLLWDFWPLGRLRLELRLKANITDRIPEEASTSAPLRLILEKLPFFAFSVLSSVVTYYAQTHGGSVAGIQSVPLTFRVVNALASYTKYIGNMLWPHNLAAIYPLPPTLTLVQAAISGFILVGVTFVVYRRARMNPFLLMGWLWYLGTLVPVIGLVQVGRQAMADRYTYIPLIGLFIMISWGFPVLTHKWLYRRSVITSVALLALAGSTLCTWIQLTYWRNGVILFRHAIQVVENNYIAHQQLGDELSKLAKYNEAIDHYLTALVAISGDKNLHMNLGVAFFQTGNTEMAIKHYYKALSLKSENDKLYYNLGLALGMQGNLNESITYLTKAVTINPKFAEAHYNLGVALVTTGRLDEGIRHFSEALQVDPGLVEARKALEAALKLKSGQTFHK